MGVRDTSVEAFHDTKPQHPRQQTRILDILARRGQPMTRGELAAMSGIALSAVCGRVNELVGSGDLIELPRRPCKLSGRSAHPVGLPPVQLSLVA